MGGSIQPSLLRVVAASSFAVIFALLFAVSDPAEATGVLFVVPVALLALSDGERGGALGSIIAVALLVLWVVVDDVHFGVLGWLGRISAFAILGVLVGRYEDLARTHERRRLDERYAAELHDRVVQSLVLARYRLGNDPEAQRLVDEALTGAKDIISSRLGDEVAPGELRIGKDRPAAPSHERRDR